ncbi:toxin CrTX-A-like [Oculina patagonica]
MKCSSLLIVSVLVVLAIKGSFGKNRKVEQQDNEEDITDILTSEGEEGWLEKVLQKAKAKHEKKQSSKDESAQDKFHDNSPPSNAISKLTGSLNKMTSNKNERWTTRAKNGLRELETNWLQTPKERRGEIAGALNAAAAKLEKFANAGKDPVGAIRGAIEIIATFSNIAGPHVQIIGVALNFISGFLSLFGKGTSPKPVSEVVREEIEKWYSRDLSNQAKGVISAFQKSKSFLNGVAKSGKQLSDSESTSLSAHVPVYHGVAFMGTLASEIHKTIEENKVKDAKKMLKVYRAVRAIGNFERCDLAADGCFDFRFAIKHT